MTKIVPELTNGEFENFSKEGLVFIDFFAEWCMPCMMMGPIIEDLNSDFSGKVKIGKVNIEDNQKLANKFGVTSIPTFVIFKDGSEIERMTGSMTQDELSGVLDKHL